MRSPTKREEPGNTRRTLYHSQPHLAIPSPPPPPERPKLGTKATVVVVLFVVAVAASLISAVAVPIANRVRRAARIVDLCETTACTSYSRMIAHSASGSVNPCHNFYRFVCEGYVNSSRSVFHDHMSLFTGVVARSLRTTRAPETSQRAFEKAAVFYQSCLAVVKEGASQFDEFRTVMLKAGIHWPRVVKAPDLLDSMVNMAVALNVFTLIFFTSSYNHGKCRVEIWKGDVLEHLKRRRRELEVIEKYKKYYDSFFEIFLNYEGNVSSKDVAFASAIPMDPPSHFEHFLRVENVAFHYLTGRRPSAKVVFDSVVKLDPITPSISARRWEGLFRRMAISGFFRSSNASSPLPCSQQITVWDVQHLRALDDLLLAMGEEKLHFYYGWTIVQALARFMSYGLAVLSYGNTKTARDESPLHCLRLVETTMGLVVYKRFAATDFNKRTRLELHQIMNVVYSALLRMLQANPELDPRETSIDLRKLEATLIPRFDLLDDEARLERFFGELPDLAPEAFARNWLQVQQALRRSNPAALEAIRAFYMSAIAGSDAYAIRRAGNGQELGLAPYVTLLPLYDIKVVDSVKYGALGSLLAAATFQFFEERLPERSRFRSLMEQRTRCYESGPLRGLRGDPAKRAAFERAVALSFVWEAFRSPLRRRGKHSRVRGLESFSEDQLFFVASCYPLCTGDQGAGPAELACNEPLRHSRHFPVAFRCASGAPMNPRLKCSVFY